MIHILIADDHALVHEGLGAVLATEPDFEVVGAARDGIEAVALAGDLRPDVILMDLVMPRLDGLEAIRQIRSANLQACILLLTSFADDGRVYQAVKAGALGYLLKDTPREQLHQAIRDTSQGQAELQPTIAFKVLQEISDPPALPPAIDPLTRREHDTLRLAAQGLSNQAIAATLGVGVITVTGNVSSILRKLHLAGRSQASLFVEPEDRLEA